MKNKKIDKNILYNSKIKINSSNKKGFSTVIVTMLILTIVIVGTVGYNTWFEGYSENMQNNVDKQTITIPLIENVLGDSIYLKNTFDESFVVDKIEIDGVVCSTNDNLIPGMNTIEISVCTSTIEAGEHEVVMVSKYGVYSKSIYFKSQGFDEFGDPFIIGDFKQEKLNNGKGNLNVEFNHNRGCRELQKIQDNLDGDYYLVQNIYCENTTLWNNGKGFIPIGSESENDNHNENDNKNEDENNNDEHNESDNHNSFTGTLNGNGFTINQLYINNDDKNTGLFAKLNNAQISNLNIIVNLITGDKKNLGGLAGDVEDSKITNVHISGNITGDKKEVGGLIGSVEHSTISKSSYSNGVVIGDRKSVGGLIGVAKDSNISNSYSTGDVIGNKDYVGGLIGSVTDSNIINSYSTGKVIGNKGKGGFIGDSSNSNINNSYWDIDNSMEIISAGGVGKTTSEMKNLSTFSNWDFTTIWSIDGGVSYPMLN